MSGSRAHDQIAYNSYKPRTRARARNEGTQMKAQIKF